ncbi:MAG: rod shape-determining protein MreC [Actinomycetes bacterium]
MRDTRRTRIVMAVLLLTAMTFIVLDLRGGQGSVTERMRTFGATVFGPVERAAAAVVRPVASFVDGVTSIGSNDARIAELEQENSALRLQVRTSELDRNRAQQLDDLLKIAGLGRYRVVPAQVIAVGSGRGFVRTVTVDAGSRDGIKIDQTVINGDGLVGRVASVGSSTATIVLLPDPSFAVGARLARTMEIGAVRGQGRAPLTLEVLNPQAQVSVSDALVTLGSRDGRPFVPGVPIGEVYKVEATPGALTRTALVKPYVDFTTLSLVGIVVQPPRRDPRDSVLPPVPVTPTPSVSLTPSPSLSGAGTPSSTPAASPSP